ncbi:alpha/beta hydrolase [Parasulfuritortus cantonensis]|uniref:Alpha/beta hydrolase n=1 Tax=Parasulfuritortus cantonensis TaxID=2528202 RepID=A0A4R1B288_9PROT|nr:CocE/NonD family hydrolase [Parasulfuritortus cantonensis]TCJ11931.1 alpha/beta hydrolase [Parasulfuritortus cantonensis]
MKAHRLQIACPGASVETVVEDPGRELAGLALIAHPHPLHGGSLDNKVAYTLARAALARGYLAVRPNFRGVGASTGAYDYGIGEARDLVAVAEHLAAQFGYLPWTLLGFSFGAYVQHRVAREIEARRLVMVGPAVSMYDFGAPAVPTAIVHGEEDELIPLAAVRAYAEAHAVPLHTIPGAGHFFHGKLVPLRTLVEGLLEP